MILLWFCCKSLCAAPWTEGIGQLINCEDAFAVQSCPVPVSQTGKEAKVVFFDCLLSAALSKLALRTVSVKDKIRWSCGRQKNPNLVDDLAEWTR